MLHIICGQGIIDENNHYTPIRMTEIQNTTPNTGEAVGQQEPLLIVGGDAAQPLWKTVGSFLQN